MSEEEFLKEYELLCQKYKMGLIGCGCCGSPSLNNIYEINYNEKLNKIFIGGNGYWHELYKSVDECDDYCKNSYEEEKTIEEYFEIASELEKESDVK